MFYVPFAQKKDSNNGINIAVRTTGDPERLGPVIKRAIFSLDQAAPVSDITSMNTLLHEFIGTTRFSRFPKIFVSAIVGFGIIALVGFGIIALVAATVPARRTTKVDPALALTST